MTDDKQRQNRRLAERKEAAFSLYYTIEFPFDLRIKLGVPGEVGGLMRDLSELGTAIVTKYDIPTGTKLLIMFNLLNSHLSGENRLRHLRLRAEVTSNLFSGAGGYRLGLRFDKVSNEDKNAIREYIKSKGGNF